MSTDQAVIVWGELLWDLFPDGARLGGAPANVAWHVGQAGGWAQLITRVGDDEPGRRAVAELADLVDTTLVQIDPERATGEVQVTTAPTGEPRYTLVPGRAWEHIACTPDAAEAIGDAGVVVFGTLAQRTREGLASWERAMAAARGRCLRVCDVNLRKTAAPEPGEDAAVRAALEHADVVKVNDQELAALGARYGWADPLAALRARRRVVAVTHGAAGSTLFGERAIEIAGTPARAGGDNVGCGDAYLAILVHGMTLGWDLESSGRAASRWAAAVAEARGATPRFDDERIDDLLEQSAA